MTITRSLLSLCFVSLLAIGCGAPQGPHIHVATANRADLEKVQDADTVWYEFKTGDVVPLQFLMIGVAVSASGPIEMRATKDFWIVMRKNMPMQISFDGKYFTPHKLELIAAVAPGDDGRAHLMWLNYMGEGDANAEIEKISAQGAQQSATPEDDSEPLGEASAVGEEAAGEAPPAE